MYIYTYIIYINVVKLSTIIIDVYRQRIIKKKKDQRRTKLQYTVVA